ncbi:U-box domain-containing protein 44-like isoform X2 [Ananas comosus]|uniref:U-box domain-containing protein 44-like isoform X2 n=1 Tax=Ananas comosus TaxID=4615 RepID=A0A6P5EDD8_ANACO|nr:U-box domain-containing protein 44-like isoform X2 [Ananas comosus]
MMKIRLSKGLHGHLCEFLNKEAVGAEDSIRTIIKFLSQEPSQDRELAVSLLYELSKSEILCEKIGSVYGAILILVGMASSKSENISTVEKILDNLEKSEENIKQMAENGRLQPLLTLLLEGSPERQLSMGSYLGELVLANDVKLFVAQTVGSSLVNVMKSGSIQAKEAALKALNQISSNEASAKVLIEAGILPPLVKDLFTAGIKQLPMRLKEVAASILVNLVSSGADFVVIPLDDNNQTLVSDETVHNLLHLIRNTGPAIECKLLQVLVELTGSPHLVTDIVTAVKSSGATISLIQFIEAYQKDIRAASLKLLRNISPYMGNELADALRGSPGHLGSLVKVISESDTIFEEQAAAAALLADLPNRDTGLTRQLLEKGAFRIAASKVVSIRNGETRINRYTDPFFEGLVVVLSRVTYALQDEPRCVALAREYNVAALFTDLLQMNGHDKVQIVAASALQNLSQESRRLTRIIKPPPPPGLFKRCCMKPPLLDEICPLHKGICSVRENFCLLEGKAVEKLVSCLEHRNEKLVEASLGALCTILNDGVDIAEGVLALCQAEGIRPVLDILIENRTELLQQRAVWAVERILRIDEIAKEVAGDPTVASALVEAFRNADFVTRQIAERALKHTEKLPNFSDTLQKIG